MKAQMTFPRSVITSDFYRTLNTSIDNKFHRIICIDVDEKFLEFITKKKFKIIKKRRNPYFLRRIFFRGENNFYCIHKRRMKRVSFENFIKYGGRHTLGSARYSNTGIVMDILSYRIDVKTLKNLVKIKLKYI